MRKRIHDFWGQSRFDPYDKVSASMSQPRTLIIINHTAAKARNAWPIVRDRLQSNGIDFESYETAGPRDATTRTRAAVNAGCTNIAVVGGDGTLSEAAEGFFDIDRIDPNQLPAALNPEATLAILPAGTGDDFARGLAGQRKPLDTWLSRFVSHCKTDSSAATKQIDVLIGTCDGYSQRFICLNASTMGIGGETATRVAGHGKLMRRFPGEARFMTAAIGGLAAWRERRVRVTIDEEKIVDGAMNLVAVANGLYAGGGMMLSPGARLDDGKLDVVTASGLSRLGVIRELPRIHSGRHVSNPKVQVNQGAEVRIETFATEDALLIEADGNVRGRTPAEFRVIPRALKIVI